MDFTVLLDSDQVIANLLERWCGVYNERYGDNLTVEEFGGEWDGISKVVKPEAADRVYDIMKEPGFFQSLAPIEGAVEGVMWLVNKGIKVFVVTAYSADPEMAKGKTAWFQRHLPFVTEEERLILCKHKDRVLGDMLVDDSVKNHKKFHKAMTGLGRDCHPICFAAPHNTDADQEPFVRARVGDWGELKDYMESFIL
jgi:5'(3')-deoxyribonucleotidase